MKKFAASLLAAACVFVSATAVLAADEIPTKDVYYGSDNSVKIESSNMSNLNEYQTVLIRKNNDSNTAIDDNDVVYVNQNSKGLSELSSFMLKSGIDDGDYIATFGNESGGTNTIKFHVGNADDGFTVSGDGNSSKTLNINSANKMKVADDALIQSEVNFPNVEGLIGDCYAKGFTFLADGTKYDKVYLISGDGKTCYGYFELDITTHIDANTHVAYGIQIYDIPADYKEMNIYLGEKTTQTQTTEEVSE